MGKADCSFQGQKGPNGFVCFFLTTYTSQNQLIIETQK